MLESAKKHFLIYFKFFRMYLKSRLIYKTDFVLGFSSQLLNLVFSVAFLTLLFTQVQTIEGWTFNEILLLAGISGVILNLHHVFFFGLYSLGRDYIVSGRFDRFKVRPLNILFQVYANHVGDDNISKFLANIAIIVYASSRIGLYPTPSMVIYGALALVSGVMVIGAIFLALSTTAFWTARSRAVFWLFFRISDFRKYPYGIYFDSVKILLVTLVPIAFMSYFPTAFILGRDEYRLLQLFALVAGPFFFLLSYQFWKFGLRHYSSTGS